MVAVEMRYSRADKWPCWMPIGSWGCYLTHQWSLLTHGDLICPSDRRGSFPRWQLCVGDVIAVPCESSQPPAGTDGIAGRNEWFPCSEPWSHAQAIAIYRNGVGNDELLSHEKKDVNLEGSSRRGSGSRQDKDGGEITKNGEQFRSYRGENHRGERVDRNKLFHDLQTGFDNFHRRSSKE